MLRNLCMSIRAWRASNLRAVYDPCVFALGMFDRMR
jgi:hypothetical protein